MKKRNIIKLIKIPKIIDDSFLYFAENHTHIPFPIKRVYYIMNADKKLTRGFHAHLKTRQALFCIQGSITLILDNGRRKEKIILKKPDEGVLINKMIWHEMYNFKMNTILLVYASKKFDQKDYIRNYKYFLKLTNEEKNKTS